MCCRLPLRSLGFSRCESTAFSSSVCDQQMEANHSLNMLTHTFRRQPVQEGQILYIDELDIERICGRTWLLSAFPRLFYRRRQRYGAMLLRKDKKNGFYIKPKSCSRFPARAGPVPSHFHEGIGLVRFVPAPADRSDHPCALNNPPACKAAPRRFFG